jgi:hypothetical protein
VEILRCAQDDGLRSYDEYEKRCGLPGEGTRLGLALRTCAPWAGGIGRTTVDGPLQKKVLMGFKAAFVYRMDEVPG